MIRAQRILTLTALGLALMSPPAGALSVSDMRALSTLGEPLRMELELYDLGGVRLDDIRIAQAQPADYSRLGLVPPAQPDDISAQLRTDEKGRVLAVLQGHQPQSDPNVSMLLELSWPEGVRLQQVATVLAPAMVPAQPAAAPAIVTAPATPSLAQSASVEGQGTASAVAVPSPVASGAQPVPPTAAADPAQVAPQAVPAATPVPSGTASGSQAGPVTAAAAPAAVAGTESQVIPVSPAETPAPSPVRAPVEVAASAGAPASAADHQGEVSLTLVNPAASPRTSAVARDEADLEATRGALLSERDALRARQAALEAEARAQDERLKFLDAQLAALSNPAKPAARQATLTDAESWTSRQTTLLVGCALLLLALMTLLLRRSAARTERLATRTSIEPAVPEYEEFKPRDSLAGFSASPAAAEAVAEVAAPVPEMPVAALAPVPMPVIASASPVPDSASVQAMPAADEADETEYDFLTDSEAAAFQTRLDLAMAYLDMNEQSAARELLERVLEGGTSDQRRQASALLVSLA